MMSNAKGRDTTVNSQESVLLLWFVIRCREESKMSILARNDPTSPSLALYIRWETGEIAEIVACYYNLITDY